MEIQEIERQRILIEQQIILKEYDLIGLKKKASFLQGFLEGYKQNKEEKEEKE